MPTFQQYIHPTYLSALGDNLAVIVSHGHDDHCDDDLLKIFDPSTTFIVPNFKSPSVIRRIQRLGFVNVIPLELGECQPLEIHNSRFQINGFINPEFSDDDSVITIATESGLVVHANDNWVPFTNSIAESISNRIQATESQRGYLFTQTNSASGYPLSYKNLKHDPADILRQKVRKMIEGGIKNAQVLGLSKIFSYAGYATPYVKGNDYQNLSLIPTPRVIKSDILENSALGNQFVEDFYPGDVLSLASGNIEKAFISSNSYTDCSVKNAAEKYYETYQCFPEDYLRFSDNEAVSEEELNWFLTQFGQFVSKKVSQNDVKYHDLIGKTFTLEVVDVSVRGTILFDDTCKIYALSDGEHSNKTCSVERSSVLKSIFKGETLFESLYNGYLGKWSRHPEDVYNKDIVMMITMFTYFYKNRVVKDYLKMFCRQ